MQDNPHPLREPDPQLQIIIEGLSRATCMALLGLPKDEEIILDDARAQVLEGYRHGSISVGDIVLL